MNSPTASMSFLKWWNSFSSSPGMARLKPVPTGSMNTRSVESRIECSLSTRRPGGGAACRRLEFHPARPEGSEVKPHGRDPGPPLKAKVMGRSAWSPRRLACRRCRRRKPSSCRPRRAAASGRWWPCTRRVPADHNGVGGLGELLLVMGRWWHRIVRSCRVPLPLGGLVAHDLAFLVLLADDGAACCAEVRQNAEMHPTRGGAGSSRVRTFASAIGCFCTRRCVEGCRRCCRIPVFQVLGNS